MSRVLRVISAVDCILLLLGSGMRLRSDFSGFLLSIGLLVVVFMFLVGSYAISSHFAEGPDDVDKFRGLFSNGMLPFGERLEEGYLRSMRRRWMSLFFASLLIGNGMVFVVLMKILGQK